MQTTESRALGRRFAWVRHRLKTMSLAEIGSRLAESGRHAWWSIRPPRRVPPAVGTRPLLVVPSMQSAFLASIDAVPEETRHRILAYSEKWLKHRGHTFALHDYDLGAAIQWHCDYSTATTAPRAYSGFINVRDVHTVGNIKYIWELNRLQHWTLLALAARWTGSEAYKQEIACQLVSWCRDNPFMIGVNWTSPLEAGIRLISWTLTMLLIGGEQAFGADVQGQMARAVSDHLLFIKRFYSKHSSANNHLIGEMTGLYVGAALWPVSPECKAWKALARAKLCEEMDRQVEFDGVHKERATEYQIFVAEFFLLAGALGEAIGEPFPAGYWERLSRLLGVLAGLADCAGNLPMFGDGDSGQVVWLPETMPERVAALLQSFCKPARPTGQDLRARLLLWGQSPLQLPLHRYGRPRTALQRYPQGGYYVLSAHRETEHEMVVVFDVGSHGMPPLYAHGHADALSFWLSYGGREFFIDPGTYCYDFHPTWRAYFRSTGSHNTVRVDALDQSTAAGTFLWRQVANGQLSRYREDTEGVEVTGWHDGYGRLADPVRHCRTIRLEQRTRTLCITDRLVCQANHDVDLFFHLHPHCRIHQVGPSGFHIQSADRHVRLRFGTPGLQFRLTRGSDAPIAGWAAPSFDTRLPTWTLNARVHVHGTSTFITEIVGT